MILRLSRLQTYGGKHDVFKYLNNSQRNFLANSYEEIFKAPNLNVALRVESEHGDVERLLCGYEYQFRVNHVRSYTAAGISSFYSFKLDLKVKICVCML